MLAILWLVLLFVIGVILLAWFLIGAIVIGSEDLCPRCGRSFGSTDYDRFNAAFVDPRFGGENPRDACGCGWRRGRRP